MDHDHLSKHQKIGEYVIAPEELVFVNNERFLYPLRA